MRSWIGSAGLGLVVLALGTPALAKEKANLPGTRPADGRSTVTCNESQKDPYGGETCLEVLEDLCSLSDGGMSSTPGGGETCAFPPTGQDGRRPSDPR